jgi:hypothetical protein
MHRRVTPAIGALITAAVLTACINIYDHKSVGSPFDELSSEEIRKRTPDDIPVMVDNDVIARQLREAALAEEGVALRERLWDEYREYVMQ